MTPYLSLDAGVLGSSSAGPIPAKTVNLYASPTPSAFVFGQVLEPLTSQYRRGLEVKALRVGRDISSERLRASEQEIVSQVRHRYCQIVVDGRRRAR
jgi:outer membrane protein